MKIQDFKNQIRTDVENICKQNNWDFNNVKQRGMAFEDWCFNLLCQKHPTADNNKDSSIFRTDDGGNDIAFVSEDTKEAYIVQSKYPLPVQSHDIKEDEVKQFFSNFELFQESTYVSKRDNKNHRLLELSNDLKYWIQEKYNIYFIFMSTDKHHEKTEALEQAFNTKFLKTNISISFQVWGINELQTEYSEITKIDEVYPNNIRLTVAENHYMTPEGSINNLTFALRGSELQKIAKQHGESLFNWNIRRYLGKKGDVNLGLVKTISEEPENFYYYNNGISALCDHFSFDKKSRMIDISRLQIVNGAQTVGAIKIADPEKLKNVLVLVKLTAIKHFIKEKGVAAELIRTNNTQNKLNIPDFRSNDQIQVWLENKFKENKARGNLKMIEYGRKRPYPRNSANKMVLKLQDLGKIRYAWLYEPRVSIAEPSKIFELKSDNGFYEFAFGVDGESVNYWTDQQFIDTLLAIYSYNRLLESLENAEKEQPDIKQLSRLKYYALKLFKLYIEKKITEKGDNQSYQELCKFGSKYDDFYKSAETLILTTLKNAYKELVNPDEGLAFSLPRDAKVWNLIQRKFNEYLEILK